MNVNFAASLFKIIHAKFLIVCYPTHLKKMSNIFFRKKIKTATPMTWSMKTLETVSQINNFCVN